MQQPLEIDYYYSAPTTSFITNDLQCIWFFRSLDGAITPFQKKLLTKKLVKTRNIAILMYMGQLCASIIRAGLFPIRRYILTIILNIFLLLFSGLGLIGALRMEPIMIFIHYGAVMIELFIMFILLFITLAKSPNPELQIFVVYLPIIFDLVWMLVLTYTNYVILSWLLFMEKVQKQNRLHNGQVISVEIAQTNERQQGNERAPRENALITRPPVPHNNRAPIGFESVGLESVNNNLSKCCLCYMMNPEVIFYKCGHFVCCISCGMDLKSRGNSCPICRAPIRDVIRVYT